MPASDNFRKPAWLAAHGKVGVKCHRYWPEQETTPGRYPDKLPVQLHQTILFEASETLQGSGEMLLEINIITFAKFVHVDNILAHDILDHLSPEDIFVS
jgi:hypothetical protein